MYAYCSNCPVIKADYNGQFSYSFLDDTGIVDPLDISALGAGGMALSYSASIVNDLFPIGINSGYNTSITPQGYSNLYSMAVNMTNNCGFVHDGGSIITDQLNVCFHKGTLVATGTGYVTIESIKVGDLVWATDPETGETALKPVVQTFRNTTEEWIHVTVDGEELTCTPNHPFYSPVKGWTNACQLRAGDILVTLNGEYVVVEQVQHELLECPETTYNFEVGEFHTYYVGNTSVLVHNECGKIETGQTKDYSVHESRRAAYRAAKRDAGVVSQQPSSVGPAINRQGHRIPGKTYVFGDKEILWHSAGHPEYGMSRHFNYNGHHYFY